MAVPHAGGNAVQRIVFAAETAPFLHVRGADKPAIKAVGPAVVGALDAAGKGSLRLRTHARAAMAANVVEGANLPALVAGNDDTFARELAQEVVTRARDLVGASGTYPGAAKEAFHLLLKHLGIGVIPRRQCFRGGHHVCAHDSLPCRTKAIMPRGSKSHGHSASNLKFEFGHVP